MQPKCRWEEQAPVIYLVLLRINPNIDMYILHAARIGHRLGNTLPSFLLVQGKTDYFFWVMEELCKALISFSKWKTKQDQKKSQMM